MVICEMVDKQCVPNQNRRIADVVWYKIRGGIAVVGPGAIREVNGPRTNSPPISIV